MTTLYRAAVQFPRTDTKWLEQTLMGRVVATVCAAYRFLFLTSRDSWGAQWWKFNHCARGV